MKRDPRLVRWRTDGVVRACESLRGGLVSSSSSRGLLTSALAFKPIECTLYRLVDAYLPAEAFSRAILCNFREVASVLLRRECNIYGCRMCLVTQHISYSLAQVTLL